MFRYIFKSLFKNDIIVEERKKRPLWLALIFLILGLGIYIIPQTVSSAKARGSQIMTKSQNYELDRGLILLAQDKFEAVIDDKGVLSTTDQRLIDSYNNKVPAASYTQTLEEKDDKDNPIVATILNVYYYDGDPIASKKTEEEFNKWINDNIFKVEDGKITVAPKSFIVITNSCFVINVYSPKNTNTNVKASATFSGLYNNSKNFNLKDLYAESSEGNIDREKTYSNIVNFLDKSYETQKIRTLWLQFGLTMGMNVAIVLIATITLFLMLRTKNSRFKDVSFYDSIKIACTMAFTPAIIGTLLTLVMPVYNFAFVIAYIFRVMFLISKKNMPVNQTPIYQARS